MKHLTLSLLGTIFALFTMAQNGGQAPENGSLKLEYLGSGKIKITNKQSCESVIKVNDSQTDDDVTISGNSYYIYSLPAGLTTNIHFKAKCTTNCGSTDFGWTELFLATLPVTFVSFDTERISDTEFWVKFEIADAKNVKQFNIQASTDGKAYRTITILFPDELQPNRKYSVKVNLANVRQ